MARELELKGVDPADGTRALDALEAAYALVAAALKELADG
jgi:hypothetical protein